MATQTMDTEQTFFADMETTKMNQTEVNAMIATDLIVSYGYGDLHALNNYNKLDLYREELDGANHFDMIDCDLWYEETY